MQFYRVCGLSVASDIALPGLIAGSAESAPQVTIRRGPVPENLPGASASGPTWQVAGQQFLMRIPDIARFLLDEGRDIVFAPESDATEADIPIFILGTVFGILLHQREQIVLHASAVRVNGRAVLFCGSATARVISSSVAGRRAKSSASRNTVSVSRLIDEFEVAPGSAAPRSRPFSTSWLNMARLRSIRRLLHRFGQIDNHSRLLLAEAVAYLAAARLALVFVPFPLLARRLGSLVPATDARVSQVRTQAAVDQVRLAEAVSWAVTRAARYLPFKAVCLPQAMAARLMLKRRGVRSVMHFGAAKGAGKPLDAHAWLDAAGVEVTGYPVNENFAEIACFV